MTPWQLAEKGTEAHEQQAVFLWKNIAFRYGFVAADDPKSYSERGYLARTYGINPREVPTPSGRGKSWQDDGGIVSVPELEWLHAIPNGGRRDGFTGAQMKAEGVKRGICDIFLPLPMNGEDNRPGVRSMSYAGLYIEMKRRATVIQREGKLSEEQVEFVAYARRVGYAVAVCFSWQDAAAQIRSYIEECRKGY